MGIKLSDNKTAVPDRDITKADYLQILVHFGNFSLLSLAAPILPLFTGLPVVCEKPG